MFTSNQGGVSYAKITAGTIKKIPNKNAVKQIITIVEKLDKGQTD